MKYRESVRNWVNGNKPLVRSESRSFLGLTDENDYIALCSSEAESSELESLLDMALWAFPKLERYVR
jgi:hypothetical protein